MTKPRIGYDNVVFRDNDGREIVGTVTGYDDGLLIVQNPLSSDHAWLVPVEVATVTDRDLTAAVDND